MSNSSPILVIVIGVLFCGLLFGVSNYAIDVMVDTMNMQTDMGIRSADSYDYIAFMLLLWRFAPLAVLIGVCLYVYEISKGSELEATKFFEYAAMLYISSFIGIILMWGFSLVIDLIFDNLMANSAVGGIDPMWDQSWVVAFCIKMGYWMLAAISIIPMILMMIFPIRAQRDSTFFEVDQETDKAKSDSALIFNPRQW